MNRIGKIKNQNMKKITIFTASTYNNVQERGAYGSMLLGYKLRKRFRMSYTKSTANRLQLMGLIRVLKDLEETHPNEQLQIELASTLNYILLPFGNGKMQKQLQKGESLLNYDLWRIIYDLGKRHLWKPVRVTTNLHERYYRITEREARLAYKHETAIVDSGFKPKKEKKKSLPVFDFSEESPEEFKIPLNVDINLAEGCPRQELIENNDPPF